MLTLLPIALLSCSKIGGWGPNMDQVKLYSDNNYSGTEEGYIVSSADLSLHFCNDCASSIRVPGGWTAIHYRDIVFQGVSETFTEDDHDLSDNIIGNNTASSLRIIKN